MIRLTGGFLGNVARKRLNGKRALGEWGTGALVRKKDTPDLLADYEPSVAR